MSDDDRDIDVESDEEVEDFGTRQPTVQRQSTANHHYSSQAEKRAHHNALERKRRDHIKDSFSSLRDTVPALNGEKASRAQILKRAAEYIGFMRTRTSKRQKSVDKLKYQNSLLEAQINHLENNRAAGSRTVDEDDGESSNNESDKESDNASDNASENASDNASEYNTEEATTDEEVPEPKRTKTLKH